MESAIRLCYSPFPSAPPPRIHDSNGSSFAGGASRIHLKFNHATTLHLSRFSTRQQVARSFRHANCMLNNTRSSMPSENERSSDNKILRGATGASLALACVVGLFSLSSKLNPKFNTAYAVPWSFSNTTTTSSEVRDIPILPGSKDALESLLEMINIDHSKQNCPKIEREPDPNTIRALKMHAVGLIRSGKKAEAQKLLENTYNKYKSGSTGLNLGMACVELLIFQGNFEGARDRLHHLLIDRGKFSSDDPKKLLEEYNSSEMVYHKSSIPQILLLKAIIHTMLKNKEATKWWEAFISTLNGNE